ncbi:MAG: M20/M25/M40 family metallo-hydrolase [Thermoanaerobaculales bacterium]|jgi:acetylornithine deacetylase/succinyl-diaminopimelate desuccinylase-like protein|nr:M20/M25/M40 family metallo-hydrolase [Thermoanaerobaculales bacterium]
MDSGRAAEWYRFAEKIEMAVASSGQDDPDGGTSGLEIEFNILDGDLRPVSSVGAGPERRSFADYLYEDRLPEWVRPSFQLEVFNWMIELTTRPHWSAVATAAEGRLLEAVLLNTLAEVGLSHGETFGAMHGVIPQPFEVGPDSVPGGWNLARRRYLEHCVELYGARLATAGIHTNHSYPAALLSWDFLHLPLGERRRSSLEDFRNRAVIRATRLLRPYCPVFIAVSAASPLTWEVVDGTPRTVLTDADSQRLLAFPNPESLDVGGLYASHADYLAISYDLVRRGIRFGANNWTPVRARSDVDPVRRNILATSDQLRELYRRGIYTSGEHRSLEEAERQLIIENLCARVDLPMNRVEVRTDEGGDSLELATAKILLKELLMLRIYGDEGYGSGYAYDAADIARVRRDEAEAVRRGLAAVVSAPHGAGTGTVREVLGRLLDELDPLAEALGCRDRLEPLRAMAGGGPNPAGELRAWLGAEIGTPERAPSGAVVVPPELVLEVIERRRRQVAAEAARVAEAPENGGGSAAFLASLAGRLASMARHQPAMPVRIGEVGEGLRPVSGGERTAEVVALAAELVRIPSVTNCADERLDGVRDCARFIAGWLSRAGLEVELFEDARYPALAAGFPGQLLAPISLSGHFDVVPPEPDDRQLDPRVEGDYLWGRGAADMKTVVASMMVWLRDIRAAGPPYPPIHALFVGNEENGEGEAWGTPQLLAELAEREGWSPEILLVGERTGERGDELFGAVCPDSRGVVRVRFTVRGARGHTGTGVVPADLLDRLIELKGVLAGVLRRRLTLSSLDGWESSARFPFLKVGDTGVYNITAGVGELGLEIRPIPTDDLGAVRDEVTALCRELGVEAAFEVMEAGVSCPRDNPHLGRLIASLETVSGRQALLGRKKPGSSARFAPGGNAVVWGQTGIGPHSRDERHFIPSIEPYLRVLDDLARQYRSS